MRVDAGIAGFKANCANGSPGANANTAKINTLMINSVGKATSILRIMYWVME